MLQPGRSNFEIQVYQTDHWVTRDYRETETQARTLAKNLLNINSIEGVRILKNWMRADGVETAREIFVEQKPPSKEVKAQISPIDEAPYCQKTSEFYRLASRTTMNRLLRRYIEQVYVTPTEMLHNYNALRRVQEVDQLFPNAVDRVATLQAKNSGEPPKDRRDHLYRVVAKMTRRAQRAEQHPNLPSLRSVSPQEAMAQVGRIAPEGEVEFFALVALCRDLVASRSWLHKLERLAYLGGPSGSDLMLPLIDRVLADLVAIPSALQDILGFQRNLGRALIAMADLMEGCFETSRSDAREQLAVLQPLIATGQLPETRQALLERLLQQLASGQPLNRHDPDEEQPTFLAVVQRLHRGTDFLGGPATAAAITRRFTYAVEAGGLTGLRQAVKGVLELFPQQMFQLHYLTALAQSELVGDLGEAIVGHLDQMISVPTLDRMLPQNLSALDRLTQAGQLFTTLSTLTQLPEEPLRQLVSKLDLLLGEYLTQTGMIDKLDDPGLPLRDRAIRLIEFCASGLLPVGSAAMQSARDRVITLLRQPNFDMQLLEGLDDLAQCERTLRNFHALLMRAGFR